MYISKIFDGNGQFWPLEALAWEMALRIKQFWKIILRSIKNHWETNLSKIIQKILARPIYQDVWFLFWIFFYHNIESSMHVSTINIGSRG